eukprot:scaffold7567_cov167-Ochromonas_danica.AAC.12
MTTRPLARQVDFDQLVKESVEGGLHSWEEAIQEAKETFEESDYDLSGLFFYTNEKEYQVKQEMEAKYRTFEEVASGKQTLVNMTFAIQGLLQTLRAHDPRGNVMIGSKRLFEQRNGFHTVLMILKEISRQESSQEDGDRSDGEEDSDEDEDDDFSHYRKLLLEAFSTLLFGEFAGNPSGYRNIQQFLCLTEEEAPFVVQLLDDVSDEAEGVREGVTSAKQCGSVANSFIIVRTGLDQEVA